MLKIISVALSYPFSTVYIGRKRQVLKKTMLKEESKAYTCDDIWHTTYLGTNGVTEHMRNGFGNNKKRLHAVLCQLASEEFFIGKMRTPLAEDRKNLHTTNNNKQSYWRSQAALL